MKGVLASGGGQVRGGVVLRQFLQVAVSRLVELQRFVFCRHFTFPGEFPGGRNKKQGSVSFLQTGNGDADIQLTE